MRIVRSVPIAAKASIALTIGNFDGVHRGHQAMLRRLQHLASQAQVPPCAMTFEPHPREFFAPDQAPARLTSLREKLERLAACGIERAYICRFDYRFAQITAHEFVERVLVRSLGVRTVLIGDDFRFGSRRSGDYALLQRCASHFGFRVEAMPSVTVDGERVSSTAIRNALERGELAHAAKLLGRPYSISGRVVHGDGLGRKLGYPTANVQMKHNRPALTGIFAVEVAGIEAEPVQGVASLGVRPTIVDRGKPVLEVYLFDFDGDVYGRHVCVEFLHKLRDEEKFGDVTALTRQIASDVARARTYFAGIDAARARASRNVSER